MVMLSEESDVRVTHLQMLSTELTHPTLMNEFTLNMDRLEPRFEEYYGNYLGESRFIWRVQG